MDFNFHTAMQTEVTWCNVWCFWSEELKWSIAGPGYLHDLSSVVSSDDLASCDQHACANVEEFEYHLHTVYVLVGGHIDEHL